MPLATIPGVFSSGQPVSSKTSTSSNSPARMSAQNVSSYISGCSSATQSKTTTFDSKKATETADSSQFAGAEEIAKSIQDDKNQKIKKLISIATGEIGVIEDAGTDNQGPGIAKYWTATNKLGSSTGYSAGWHWCAAFISWCIKEAGLFDEEVRPKEIAAFAFGNLPPAKGNWIDQRGGKNYATIIHRPKEQDLQAGDLVIFSNSHIGLITEPYKDGAYTTVEGNTSSDDKNVGAEIVDRDGIGVFKKRRKEISKIKSIIRLYPEGIDNSDKTAIASK